MCFHEMCDTLKSYIYMECCSTKWLRQSESSFYSYLNPKSYFINFKIKIKTLLKRVLKIMFPRI